MNKETGKSTVRVEKRRRVGVKKAAQIGMLSAIAAVLMLFEFPLPFVPNFYKLDISELPVLIGTFALGPISGAVIEFIKVMLNFVLNGTTTGGIGEVANFLIGCAMCVPAGVLYHKIHTKKGAVYGLAAGTVTMTVFGCVINAFVLLPVYAAVYGMPLDGLIEMGHAVNPAINSLTGFIIMAVAPFNLMKCLLISGLTLLVYKKIAPVLHR